MSPSLQEASGTVPRAALHPGLAVRMERSTLVTQVASPPSLPGADAPTNCSVVSVARRPFGRWLGALAALAALATLAALAALAQALQGLQSLQAPLGRCAWHPRTCHHRQPGGLPSANAGGALVPARR